MEGWTNEETWQNDTPSFHRKLFIHWWSATSLCPPGQPHRFSLSRDCKNHLNITQILGLPLQLFLNDMFPICLAALPCIFQKDAGDDVCQCINSSACRWNGCVPFFHPKRCKTWAWLLQICCINIAWWKRTDEGYAANKTYSLSDQNINWCISLLAKESQQTNFALFILTASALPVGPSTAEAQRPKVI